MKTLTVLTLGALAFGGLTGCESKGKAFRMDEENLGNGFSFSNFKEYRGINSGEGSYGGISITSADFDGDGDIDIATMSAYGTLTIYENKIPQKVRAQ
jgi:hypothetical protein